MTERERVNCAHCLGEIYPVATIYGDVWFAVLAYPPGVETHECPGRPFGLQTYGPHEPKKPESSPSPAAHPTARR